jgi:hypothetical protein
MSKSGSMNFGRRQSKAVALMQDPYTVKANAA